MVLGYIDSVATVLNQESQQRNFKKWPVLGQYVWPNYKFDINSFNGEVEWMKNWIKDRMSYLDATFNFSISGVNESAGQRMIVNAFPNPFDRDVVFEYEIPGPGATKIEILDVLGRNVSTIVDSHGEAGRYSTQVAIATPPGLYVYRVTHNDGLLVTGKLCRK